jgi:hypothetical protein
MRSQNGSNNIDFNLEPNTNAGMLFARNVASGQAPVQVLPGTSGKQVYGFEAPYQKMFDVVDAISTSGGGGGGLPTKKAVADAMCKTVWTGNLALIAALSNTRFSATMPVMLSKKYYIVLHFTGSLASSSSSSSSSSIDFAAILKPSATSDYNDTKTTVSVAQRMSANIALNANIVITFTSNNVSVFVSAVGDLPYVKSLTLRQVDILAKII